MHIEIGLGSEKGRSVIDRSKNPESFGNGGIMYVAVDEEKGNLSHLETGTVVNMELHDFAASNIFDGEAETVTLFNVFGQPREIFLSAFESRNVSAHFELRPIFEGLARKLKPGGSIVIGEHITPEFAIFLLNPTLMKMYKELGLTPVPYRTNAECRFALDSLGYKEEFISGEFLKMHGDHDKYRREDTAPFLLILTKSADAVPR